VRRRPGAHVAGPPAESAAERAADTPGSSAADRADDADGPSSDPGKGTGR